jgi:hypothetical protein
VRRKNFLVEHAWGRRYAFIEDVGGSVKGQRASHGVPWGQYATITTGVSFKKSFIGQADSEMLCRYN